MHEGPLLTDDAEKLMPKLAPFDKQLDEPLKLLSQTDYAGKTVGLRHLVCWLLLLVALNEAYLQSILHFVAFHSS